MFSVHLLLPLGERMLLIWFFAYIFSKTKLFWNIVNSRVKLKDKMLFIAAFSLISILGTYIGIPLEDGAIANIRPIGAIVAGYIGGPGLGSVVGLISGLHRFSLGGFTAFACGVATILEGLSGGILGLKFKKNFLDLRGALLAGVVGEILQVGAVLLLAKPFESALAVEQIVAIPMIVVNTIGVLGFCYIIRDVFMRYNGMILSQFNRFVDIEKGMAEAVAKGLTPEAVQVILEDLVARTELKGIFVLADSELIGYCGNDTEVQQAVSAYRPMETWIPIKSGMLAVSYYCIQLTEMLGGKVYCLGVRMMNRGYYDQYVTAFADRLAELLNNQIAQVNLSKVQDAFDLAQLKALKAQIQPHFLYNALSTISSFCRTNPVKARELILDLSQYFRRTMDVEAHMVQLSHELDLITAYLHIEKARFGERLVLEIDVASEHLKYSIPVFSIQPLIENAVKYGVAPLEGGGYVSLVTKVDGDFLTISIENSWDTALSQACEGGCGKALDNIKERLARIYGHSASLTLDFDQGKRVIARIEMPILA